MSGSEHSEPESDLRRTKRALDWVLEEAQRVLEEDSPGEDFTIPDVVTFKAEELGESSKSEVSVEPKVINEVPTVSIKLKHNRKEKSEKIKSIREKAQKRILTEAESSEDDNSLPELEINFKDKTTSKPKRKRDTKKTE